MNKSEKMKLLANALVKYLLVYVILGLIFFLTAGTIDYPHAWIYIILMSVFMGVGLVVLYVKDKELLIKRLKAKEKEKQQIFFIVLSTVIIAGIYALPGLDYRYGWSSVPSWLVTVAGVLLATGYFLDLRVMLENSYASRVIEIQEKQKLIDTGLYSVVRHPMYFSMVLIYLATPLVLGSYVALIPALLFPFSLVLRIRNEEKVLKEGLEGYGEYMKKVRYRLIPFVW